MSLWSITFSLFILMDAVGNIPLYMSFLKGIPAPRQKGIIIREFFIALGIILLFVFLGDAFMHLLNIRSDTIQISGGILLFLLALKMVFPSAKTAKEAFSPEEEPLIVPLAVPLIAGPGVLAAVMIYAEQQASQGTVALAVLIAWGASLAILLASPFFEKLLGSKGLSAMERLMGLLLTLIAIEMFLGGFHGFCNRIDS